MSETPGFRRRVFVVMPFGKKDVPKKPAIEVASTPDTDEKLKVDFDAVYSALLKPALTAAGLQPFRADEEEAAGDILKDMFAELVTADFVVADISILNANVFYELGIRHMVGPRGVICLHAGWSERPFDIAPQRTFKYDGKLFAAGLAQDDDWRKRVAQEAERLGETLRRAVEADQMTEGSPVYGNLPNLVPPDASQIGTVKFRHYQARSDEWNKRVLTAGREGRAEDILTLAGDAPSPYYRRKLLRHCGEALLALGRFAPAEKIFKELCEDLDGANSLEEIRVKCQLALIADRLGRTGDAEERLGDLAQRIPGDAEVQGLLGRVYKDMWRNTWKDCAEVSARLAAAQENAHYAHDALASYQTAVRRDPGSYYNGINVVALATLLAHVAHFSRQPLELDLSGVEDLPAVVRFAAAARLESKSEFVWARATLGELLLLQGDGPGALIAYREATADSKLTWFNVRSMFEQVQLFQALGFRLPAVNPVAELLQRRLAALPHPAATFNKVAICSGHMIDAPGRQTPRFPAAKADAVRGEITRQLDEWQIGPGDLAVCGGACGADILFAEECLRRGAAIQLRLAQDVPDYVRESVQFAGSGWVQRFHALREKAAVAVQPERLGPAPPDVSIYARTNLWIINTARVQAADCAKIRAVLVWDQQPTGDGPGGTSDFEARVGQLGGLIEIINPLKL